MRVCNSLSVLLVVAAATSLMLAQGAGPGAVVTLAVAGRSNSAPWVAAQGRDVAVTWAAATGGKSDIFVATSGDTGATFSAPVQVNAVPGDGRVGGEIPPRVALRTRAGTTPEVVVAWNAKDQGTEIKIARSVDGGRTFGAPASLQAAGAAGDRGWHALVLDDQGVAHALWLDHRGLAGPKTEHAHGAASDGVGRMVVAWDESLGGVRTAAYSAAERAAERAADGTVRVGPATRFAAEGPTLYPVMAGLADGVVTAWTAGAPGSQVIQVRQLVAAGRASLEPR